MTIQISVIIWTVICFVALYFILNNLLFKPLLTVMDKRREKSEKAEHERELARLEVEKKRAETAASIEAEHDRKLMEAKAETEKIRFEGKQKLEEAKKNRVAKVEEHRLKAETEFASDMETAKTGIDGIADVFLEKLGGR